LARATNERFALGIFFGAGGFADKHQFGIRIPNTKNDLGARPDQVSAFDTDENCLPERIKGRVCRRR
jgi:hypothetical protein